MLRDHDPMAGHGGGARRPPGSGRGQPRTGLDSGWLGPHGGSAPVGANARHGVRRTVAVVLRVARVFLFESPDPEGTPVAAPIGLRMRHVARALVPAASRL